MDTVVYSLEDLQEPMGLDDVIGNLEVVVDDYGPDWVDPNTGSGCKNVYWYHEMEESHGEDRFCIAAKHLRDSFVFIDTEWLQDYNTEAIDEVIERAKYDLPIKAERLIDFSGEVALQLAQNLQDKGEAWGFVLWYVKQNREVMAKINSEFGARDLTSDLTRHFTETRDQLIEEYKADA